PMTIAAPIVPIAEARVGSFVMNGRLTDGEGEEGVYVGYDIRLKRPVWIHVTPPGTPPVSALRRNTHRSGRLRWLAGIRTDHAAGDAYEAGTGASFAQAAGIPVGWPVAKHWLADLARELDAASDERAMPPLSLDGVWIGADNHAKIVEFMPAARCAAS